MRNKSNYLQNINKQTKNFPVGRNRAQIPLCFMTPRDKIIKRISTLSLFLRKIHADQCFHFVWYNFFFFNDMKTSFSFWFKMKLYRMTEK